MKIAVDTRQDASTAQIDLMLLYAIRPKKARGGIAIMMNTVSNDMLIVDMLNSLTDKISMDRINDVKAVLYMHLGTKKIYEDVSSSQLPAGYTDDTPRVIELWLQCLRLERRTENTINNYRLEIRNFFSARRKELCRRYDQ